MKESAAFTVDNKALVLFLSQPQLTVSKVPPSFYFRLQFAAFTVPSIPGLILKPLGASLLNEGKW